MPNTTAASNHDDLHDPLAAEAVQGFPLGMVAAAVVTTATAAGIHVGCGKQSKSDRKTPKKKFAPGGGDGYPDDKTTMTMTTGRKAAATDSNGDDVKRPASRGGRSHDVMEEVYRNPNSLTSEIGGGDSVLVQRCQ